MSEVTTMPDNVWTNLPPLHRDVTPPRQFRLSLRRDSTRTLKENGENGLPDIAKRNSMGQNRFQVAGTRLDVDMSLPSLYHSSRRPRRPSASEPPLAPAPRRSMTASSNCNAFNAFGGGRMKRMHTQLSQDSSVLKGGFERSRTFQTELKLFGPRRERTCDTLSVNQCALDTARTLDHQDNRMSRPLSSQKTMAYLFPSSPRKCKKRMPKWQQGTKPHQLDKLRPCKDVETKPSPRVKGGAVKRKWYLGGIKVNSATSGGLMIGDCSSIDNDVFDAALLTTQRSQPGGRTARRGDELRPQSVAMVLRYMEDLRTASPFQQLRPGE